MATFEMLSSSHDTVTQQALHAAGVGCWEWNFATNHIQADALFVSLLDLSVPSDPAAHTATQTPDTPANAFIGTHNENLLASIRERILYVSRTGDVFHIIVGGENDIPDISLPIALRGKILARDANGVPQKAAGTIQPLSMNTDSDRRHIPEYLHLLLDSAALSMWHWNLVHDRFCLLNQFATPRGHDPHTFGPTFQAVLDVVHPHDLSIVRNMVRKVREETKVRRASLVYRVRSVSGEWGWVHTTVVVLSRDPLTGQAIEVFGLNQDVTEFKEAEQALDSATERLQIAMEATRLTLWEWDIPSGKIDVLNQRKEILGFDPTADINFTVDFFMSLVHPDDLAIVEEHFIEIANPKETMHTFTVRMRRQDQSWAWVQIFISVSAWTSDQRPQRLLGVGVDITESMEVEHAANQAEQERSIIIDSVREALFYLNPTMNVTWMNQNASRLFSSIESFDLASQDQHCCIFHKKDPCEICAAKSVFQSGHPIDQEKCIDGRYYRMLLNPVFDTHQNVRGCVGSVLDVTDQRKMEQELLHSQKMQAIGQLAGGVAHDFNNRLNSIMGFAQLLAEELQGKEPTLFGFAQRIVSASKRAANLTRQLLAFARKGQYRQERVNLHDLVEEVILFVEHTFDKRIIMTRDLQASSPFIMGDSDQVQNVLLNLAINARDAMPQGGTLTFRTENLLLEPEDALTKSLELAPGPYICVHVIDTGSGIPPEVAPHVFEPFFTTKPIGEGTGMGLPSAYGTVSKHNGSISFDTSPEGTDFRLHLPSITAESEKEPTPSHITARGRILVVDDDDQLLSLLSTALSKDGYSVITAASGTDGLRAYRHDPIGFDMVIIDMIMPDLSGVEVFDAIRRIKPQQLVTVCSGYSCEEQIALLSTYDTVEFLKKPFSLATMRDIITKRLFQQL